MKTTLILSLFLLTVSLFTFLPDTATANITKWGLPEGAVARLGKGTINEIAFSPDGTRLAVATSIGIWIYDARSGEEVNLFTGSTAITFLSRDWKTLAIPNRSEIGLWDVETGVHKHTLTGHRGSVGSVVFSPDGKTLASTDWDGIRLWDVEAGTHKHTLTEHTAPINSMSFSPDGKTLASGSLDFTIRLWDVETGKHKHTLTEYVEGDVKVLFSPDGGTLVSGATFNDTIHLWDVDTGGHKHALTGHANVVYSISFSPDGKTLAIPNGKEVNLWDAKTGVLMRTLTGYPYEVACVSYSRDGTLVTAGTKEIRLWNSGTGTLKHTVEWWTEFGYMSGVSIPSEVYSVSFSLDGSTLATASRTEIRIWNVDAGVEKHTITGHTEGVVSVSFSPDGETLVSTSSQVEPVRVWDVETGTEKPLHTAHTRGYSAVLLSPDGKTQGNIKGQNTILLSDVETNSVKHTLMGHTDRITWLVFSPDSSTLASGSDDKTIRLWDVETGELTHELTGHTAEINSVVFSPDSSTLASGGGWTDKTIRLWDVETGELTHELTGQGDYAGAQFHSDSRTLASWDRNATFYLWDVETGELTHELIGHTQKVNGVSFSPDGKTLASGSSDGTVLVWNLIFAPTEPEKPAKDVNGDGIVNIQDLVLVAGKLGQTGTDSADINGDGQINIQDLVLVAGALGTTAAAPSLHPQALEMLTATEIKQWLSEAQQLGITDTMSQRGILFLQQLLAKLTPKKTTLLANFPNPFNPETWIPYHLAKDTDVTLHIYAVNGTLVRTLTLGHQAAGMYQNRSRAAYWDGKNELGEKVASGLYFYTLTAGDFTATRKMLIQK